MQELSRENVRVNDNNPREIEIDLVGMLRKILKRLWLILLVAVIFGAGMFAMAEYVIQPTYRSSFSAYVNNKQSQSEAQVLSNSDINAQHQLASTYSTIITSNTVLTAAADAINLDYPYSRLKAMVKASEKNDTGLIEVSVTSKSKDMAYMLADSISKVAPEYMSQIVEGSSMKLVDQAVYPTKKYAPSTTRYTLLGALGGAALVLIIIIIRYFTDDTLSGESDLEQHYALPIVGVIPDYTKVGKEGKGSYGYAYRVKSGDKGGRSNGKKD